jgi:hypothetical protein
MKGIPCQLFENKDLNSFASETLFRMIKKAKHLGIRDLHTFLSEEFLQKKFSKQSVFTKLGFNCDEKICKDLIQESNLAKFQEILESNSISLLQITGSFYNFSWRADLFTKAIESDSVLKKEFLDIFYSLFGVKNLSFKSIVKLGKRSHGNWFIPWVFTYGKRERKNIVRAGMNYDTVYVREALGYSRPMKKSDVRIKTIKKSNCSFKQFPKGTTRKIATGDSYFKVVKNGIFENLMKQNRRKIISGFSGSCIMIYQIVFDILKLYPKTMENKIKLLLCIIADFVPTYHSLPEILMPYSREAEFPVLYDLDMNEDTYLKNLLKQHLPSFKL